MEGSNTRPALSSSFSPSAKCEVFQRGNLTVYTFPVLCKAKAFSKKCCEYFSLSDATASSKVLSAVLVLLVLSASAVTLKASASTRDCSAFTLLVSASLLARSALALLVSAVTR